MNKSNKFSPEVRERAVRMVLEHRGSYPSLWSAVESIAPQIGWVPQTLLEWVKREEIDAGSRPGVITAEKERIKGLEREVKELRQANEILKTHQMPHRVGRPCHGFMFEDSTPGLNLTPYRPMTRTSGAGLSQDPIGEAGSGVKLYGYGGWGAGEQHRSRRTADDSLDSHLDLHRSRVWGLCHPVWGPSFSEPRESWHQTAFDDFMGTMVSLWTRVQVMR